MGVFAHVYNRRWRLLALWEKKFKGRWRVLACVSANADEVPKNQVGVFVGKILKDVCVFSCTYACAEAAGVGGGFLRHFSSYLT